MYVVLYVQICSCKSDGWFIYEEERYILHIPTRRTIIIFVMCLSATHPSPIYVFFCLFSFCFLAQCWESYVISFHNEAGCIFGFGHPALSYHNPTNVVVVVVVVEIPKILMGVFYE